MGVFVDFSQEWVVGLSLCLKSSGYRLNASNKKIVGFTAFCLL